MEEIIDFSDENKITEIPPVLKTLSIISIIGSSFWGIVVFVMIIWLMVDVSALGRFAPGFPRSQMSVFMMVMIVFLLLNILGIIGAAKMMKGKKAAFTLYAIVTGLWAFVMLISGFQGVTMNLMLGLISVGFIVAFGFQMKKISKGVASSIID